jgi:protein gp37
MLAAAAITQLYSSILATPPPPVLPNPLPAMPTTPIGAPTAITEEPGTCTTMRQSKRLMALSMTSANPTTRATGTKLKKMGLLLNVADPKYAMKLLLLEAYAGPAKEVVEEAISNLLGIQPHAAKKISAVWMCCTSFQYESSSE